MKQYKTSPSIVELSKAIAVFHSLVGAIGKDQKNPFFNSQYASLSNILKTIKTPLQRADLVLTQSPVGKDCLVSMLIHTQSGEYIRSVMEMQIVKDNVIRQDPQGQGTVISYMRRYAIGAILNLNIDEDVDANSTVHPSTEGQLRMIESLLRTADLDATDADSILQAHEKFSYDRAQKCIDYLLENQIQQHPKVTGGQESKTAMNKAIKEAVENPKT